MQGTLSLEVERLSYRSWEVDNPETGGEYFVWLDDGPEGPKWVCTCEYYRRKARVCKHIRKVKEELGIGA